MEQPSPSSLHGTKSGGQYSCFLPPPWGWYRLPCSTGALTDQHDDQVRRSVFFNLVNPVRDRLEGGAPCEVIGNDGRMRTAVVALCDGAEALLTSRVPHLQLMTGQEGTASGVALLMETPAPKESRRRGPLRLASRLSCSDAGRCFLGDLSVLSGL